MINIRGDVLTCHRGLNVEHMTKVLIGHGGSHVRHVNGSPNRSRKTGCLIMVKFRQVKVDHMSGTG